MITITIVGVLTAIAVPAYQDYVTRSQVAEAISLASGYKTDISEYYSNTSKFPSNEDINGNLKGQYSFINNIKNGNILATFNNFKKTYLFIIR